MSQTPQTIDALMARFRACPWAGELEHICLGLSDEQKAHVSLCLVEAHAMGYEDGKAEGASAPELLGALTELLCWHGPGSAASLGAKCETLAEAQDRAHTAIAKATEKAGSPTIP